MALLSPSTLGGQMGGFLGSSTFVPQLIITASASLPTLNLLLWAVIANPEGLLFPFGLELS